MLSRARRQGTCIGFIAAFRPVWEQRLMRRVLLAWCRSVGGLLGACQCATYLVCSPCMACFWSNPTDDTGM